MLFGHYTRRNEDTDILENHKKFREKQGLKGNVGPFLPTWALHGLPLAPHRFGRDALSELREGMDLSVPSEGNSSARVPVLECRSRRYGLRTRKGGTGANLRLSVSGRCSAALYGASRQARTVGARGAGRRGRAGERLGRGPDRRPYSCRIPCRPAEESGGGASGTFRTTDFPVSDYCALFSR